MSSHVERWVRRWVRSDYLEIFGESLVCQIEAAMRAHRDGNLSALVLEVSLNAENPRTTAEDLAVAAHLFYCAVGLVDDIQDGDASEYLPVPVAEQINVVFAMRELAAVKILDVMPSMPFSAAPAILRILSNSTLRMCGSQAEELSTEVWSIEAYERVARGSAGSECGFLLYLVGLIHSATAESLRAAGEAMGVLLQIRRDIQTSDPRITSFTIPEIAELREKAELELEVASDDLTPPIRETLFRAVGKEIGDGGHQSH